MIEMLLEKKVFGVGVGSAMGRECFGRERVAIDEACLSSPLSS